MITTAQPAISLHNDINPLLTQIGEDVMGFLNEIQLQYPQAISFASGRPDENYFTIEDFTNDLDHYVNHQMIEENCSRKEVLNKLGQYNRAKGLINKEVAQYLSTDESIEVDPEDILITVGAQEAITIGLMTVCDRDNDVILVEDPAYIGITHLAKINGYHVDAIPVISNKSSLKKLEEKIIHYAAVGKKVKVVYTIPDFQNPTGNAMSVEDRERLLELAQRYGFLIFEDNAYGDFSYESQKYPTLKSIDYNHSVIYIKSLSKTLYPSLRLCIMVVTQQREVNGRFSRMSDIMAKTKGYTTVNTPLIIQAMFSGLLRKNEFSLKKMNEEKVLAMKLKRNRVLHSLEHFFDKEKYLWAKDISWNKPKGGFFITVKVPFRITKEDVVQCAERFHTIFTPMSFFYLKNGGEYELRLAFSNISEHEIQIGIQQLASFIREKVLKP